MIRSTCFIVPPVLTVKATNTDRLSLRISYTLRLYPKAQQLPLPIDREDEAVSLDAPGRIAPLVDQW